MGILNLTPDSFSDGGCHPTVQAAVDAALRMVDAGARILDLGGESTRPGSEPVGDDEELRRVLPVVEALRAQTDVVLSIDTYRARVAAETIAAGADIINDISGGAFEPALLDHVARAGAGLVLMHTTARPAEMTRHLVEGDVVTTVRDALAVRIAAATAAGISRQQLVLDPGYGFGKTPLQNLALLRNLDALHALGLPLLVGVSRKRMIREVVGTAFEALEHGTTVAHVHALQAGAQVLRTHNVAAAMATVGMVAALHQTR